MVKLKKPSVHKAICPTCKGNGFLKIIDQEDPQEVLSQLMEDIERVIDDNDVLIYDDTVSPNLTTTSLTLQSLSTDEGVLNPLGIGEMTIECRY